MTVPPKRTGPLVGLKILEIGHYIAAPFCTRILADLGAEVIKIEPPGGDPFRGWGAAVDGHSVWFSIHGRNKLSVVLDLKRERDIALKLAARADVLVENLRAGRLERLRLGPDVLHAVNPRLVIARISGYGQDGPVSRQAGVRRDRRGDGRHPPPDRASRRQLPICRRRAAASRSAMIWPGFMPRSACCRRCGSATAPGTGRGRVVDVNLVDSVFSLMEGMLPEYAMDGRIRQPVGAAIATAAPTNTYPCADGKWLCIAGNSDLIFARLMAAIGRPELASDPDYATNGRPLRTSRRAGCGDRAPGPARCRRRRRRTRLDAAEVPCSRLYDIADCATDPHFRARGSVQEIDDPLIGRTLHPGPAIRLDGDPPEAVVGWTGPAAGAHTDYVLRELLGMSDLRATR